MKANLQAAILVIIFCSRLQQLQAQKLNWEWNILHNIADSRTPGKTSFYKNISASTYILGAATPAAYLVAGLANHDQDLKKTALYFTESIAISQVISFSTKTIVNRPRPELRYPGFVALTTAHNASFPSGHTSAAFALATSFSLINHKWYVVIPSYTWASLVGYSRLYLGVHYPTDIIAGAIVGTGSAWLNYKLNKWMHPAKTKKLIDPPAL